MPTYEYECLKCGYRFDLFHGINEEPEVSCPKCNGQARKLIGAGIGLIFKGTGFYITDYKKKNSKEGSKEGKKGDDKSGGGEEKK